MNSKSNELIRFMINFCILYTNSLLYRRFRRTDQAHFEAHFERIIIKSALFLKIENKYEAIFRKLESSRDARTVVINQ